MNSGWVCGGRVQGSNEPVKLALFWPVETLQLFYTYQLTEIGRGHFFFFPFTTPTNSVYGFVFANLAVKWRTVFIVIYLFYIYTCIGGILILVSPFFITIIIIIQLLPHFYIRVRCFLSVYPTQLILSLLQSAFLNPPSSPYISLVSRALIATPLKPDYYKLLYRLILVSSGWFFFEKCTFGLRRVFFSFLNR